MDPQEDRDDNYIDPSEQGPLNTIIKMIMY